MSLSIGESLELFSSLHQGRLKSEDLRKILSALGCPGADQIDFDQPDHPVFGFDGHRILTAAKWIWENRATIMAVIRVLLLFI